MIQFGVLLSECKQNDAAFDSAGAQYVCAVVRYDFLELEIIVLLRSNKIFDCMFVLITQMGLIIHLSLKQPYVLHTHQ